MMFNLPRYKIFLAIADFLLVLFSLAIALFFVSVSREIGLGDIILNSPQLIFIFLIISFSFVVIFQANNLYKINIFMANTTQFNAIIKSLSYGTIFSLLLTFFLKLPHLFDSRLFFISFLFTSGLFFIAFRIYLLKLIFKKLTDGKFFHRNLLIIGAGKTAKLFAAKLFIEEHIGMELIGFIDDNIPKGMEIINKKKILGSTLDISTIIKKYNINEIIIAIDKTSHEKLLEVLDYCNKNFVTIKIFSELFKIIHQKVITEQYSGIPVINASPQINSKLSLLFKRAFDFVGSIVGLIILSPLFIIIAVIIKLTSKGPILFKQQRVGKDGKVFDFYKFRSMRGSEEDDVFRKKKMLEFMESENVQDDVKVINDSRVTWIGKIIRKFSIDELPQLINVVKGDMSLVGPRPALLYEYENYCEWQKRRFDVLPGCTGVWQVYGRSNVPFKDSILLDLYYIYNMSPWLDLQLVLKTIPVMILGRGGK